VDWETIVVGAGIAGLSVADRLGRAGHRVVVLDARERVGGRLRSRDGLDLGASWFWPGEHRVGALVGELGIDTHAQHIAGDALYDAPGGVVRLDGNPIDVPAMRFSSGADALANSLARRVEARPSSDLRVGSDVHRIVVAADGAVRVSARHGQTGGGHHLSAHHVVLALPPALAASAIEIEPSLPPDLAALAARTPVWMGAITKAVVRYARPFWRDAGLAGAAISHRGPLREIHDLSGPAGEPAALFGFASTGAADGPLDTAAVVAQLARLFGEPAASPIDIELADWRLESATSPPGVELLNDYSTYGDPRFGVAALGGRLHWSSTETSTVAPGHIEGALAAAERAATAVDRQLTGRQT
jgi:monoamine oxidase